MGDPDAPPLQAASLIEALDAHGVKYVIVGGLAAVAHGATHVTFDMDVVPEWSKANLRRLADALVSMHARLHPRGSSEPVEFPIDVDALRQFEVSTWRTDLGDLDVIIGTPTSVRGRLADYRALKARASERLAFGLTIQVADLDDVIESKEALGREADLVVLPELRRMQDRARRDE